MRARLVGADDAAPIEVRDRLDEVIGAHLQESDFARGENSWMYLNRLARNMGSADFWANVPGLIPNWLYGQRRTSTAAEIGGADQIALYDAGGDEDRAKRASMELAIPMIEADAAGWFCSGALDATINSRRLCGLQVLGDGVASLWRAPRDPSSDPSRYQSFELVDSELDYVGGVIAEVEGHNRVAFLNVRSPLGRWFARLCERLSAGDPLVTWERVRAVRRVIYSEIVWGGRETEGSLKELQQVLSSWNSIDGLPEELRANDIPTDRAGFRLMGSRRWGARE